MYFLSLCEVGDRWAPVLTFTTGLLFAFHEAGRSGLQITYLKTSLLFAFPETPDRWAPVEEFTISLLFALQNGSNNRNRVSNQSLSLVDTKSHGNSQGRSHGKDKEGQNSV